MRQPAIPKLSELGGNAADNSTSHRKKSLSASKHRSHTLGILRLQNAILPKRWSASLQTYWDLT